MQVLVIGLCRPKRSLLKSFLGVSLMSKNMLVEYRKIQREDRQYKVTKNCIGEMGTCYFSYSCYQLSFFLVKVMEI